MILTEAVFNRLGFDWPSFLTETIFPFVRVALPDFCLAAVGSMVNADLSDFKTDRNTVIRDIIIDNLVYSYLASFKFITVLIS